MSHMMMSKSSIERIKRRAQGERFDWSCPECSRAHGPEDYHCMCGMCAPPDACPEDTLKLVAEIQSLQKTVQKYKGLSR